MRLTFTAATLLLIFSIVLAQSAAAQNAGDYHVKAFGGLSSLQGDTLTFGSSTSSLNYDSGGSFGGAFRFDYADSPFRAEIEFNYRSGDASDIPLAMGAQGDFASTSLMVNGYYVFGTASQFKPYVGLSLGALTEVDFDIDGTGGGSAEFRAFRV